MADTDVAQVPLESILCTDELNRRPSRPTDYEKENRALVALIQTLTDSPENILQTLADTILDVMDCGSAGISLLTTNDGGKRFHWPAIAGAWKPYIGGGTPRDFGPCGDVLDRDTPLLFKNIERRYKYFQPVTPQVEEALLVPFYVGGKAAGTIWAVAHNDHKFDAEDKRQLISLARFASAAYQSTASLDASKHLAAIVESSDDAIISKTLDGIITSWNKSAESLFGYTPEEAIGQHITLIIPADRREEEAVILAKLKAGDRIEHFETVRVRKDGTTLDISLTISPVKDGAGRIIGASKVARDITERKSAEHALRQSEDRFRNLAETLDAEVRIRTKELEERNAEVVQQSEQVRDLSHRLMQAEDDQRRHIARELHDSVGQLLAALSMSVAQVQRQAGTLDVAARRAVSDSVDLVEQITREVRTISYLLHPPLLDIAGLASALRWYVDGFSERSKIRVDVQIPDQFPRLPNEMELAIFRMVQECLTNIHRHSGSDTAAIAIDQEGPNVVVQVRDAGRGIPLEKQMELTSSGGPGVGFRGMRERLKQLGGDLNILSDNPGTVVTARLPHSPVTSAMTSDVA